MDLLLLAICVATTAALPYDPEQTQWNLNQNKTATSVLDYWGEWENHTYTPSPDNWRFPVYTLMLDRFVNGDPTNDNANGTAWEQDMHGTQLRHGGDVQGLQDTLDYLQGMGIKGVYLAGSPMINFAWGSDAFSPLDLTLLDAHFATITVWQDVIADLHARGMYIILDNTMATLGDLIGFEGALNISAPLAYGEHDAMWKTDRRYHDFDFNNKEQDICETPYPRFWDDHGEPVHANGSEYLIGCRDSDFDQYGDIAAFDPYPEWQRQISKFASVQDRLREWKPSVREKIQHMSCMQIAMLDIDGFRMDKGQQITVDAQAEFADYIRQCAGRFGKKNFFIPGEIVSGNTFGSVYLGRGKEPNMRVNDTDKAVQLTTDNADDSGFIRAKGKNAFDAACFHYSTYRSFERFLGMDGNLGAEGEGPVDFIEAWTTFIQTNDFINPSTGVFDPRHMYGAQNQDVFRWPTIQDGTVKQNLANFIVTLLLPGIPLLEWGEEQAFYALDNTANNYVFGRQAMSASTAWQTHGCYTVGNAKFSSWPPGNYSNACKDDWNSLDHRDPAHPIRNLFITMFEMRQRYPVLNDGFNVQTLNKQTHPVLLPGSLGTPTDTGFWSVRRSGWPDLQDFTTQGQKVQDVWIMFQNEAKEATYSFDCTTAEYGLLAPFPSGTTVRNLLYPYDLLTLASTTPKTKLDSKNSVDGCLNSMTLPGWGFKAYVPSDRWVRPSPVLTKFTPGHDYRVESNETSSNEQKVAIEFHFSDEMNCEDVLGKISCDSKTEDGTTAALDLGSFSCHTEDPDFTANTSPYTDISTGQIPSVWRIAGNLVNVSDGVHTLTVGNVTNEVKNASTNSVSHFLLRVGRPNNPIVFPRTGNYSNNLLRKDVDDNLYVSHVAAGADKFQYSLNWGSSWSDWQDYQGGNVTLKDQPWSGTKQQAWEGHHVQVQYWSQKTGALAFQEGDLAKANTQPRRFPHAFLHGSWNSYGYDQGLPHIMKQVGPGDWAFNFMTEWPSEFQVNVWGSNPDGQPDLTRSYGDVDLDGILDRVPPVSLLKNVVNVTAYPPKGRLAYRLHVNDAALRYSMTPIGSSAWQATIFALLAIIPVILALSTVFLYLHSFYDIKLNVFGKRQNHQILPIALKEKLHVGQWLTPKEWPMVKAHHAVAESEKPPTPRKTVLIATMEYDIEDWAIKIKIGGLGVMSQLMGQHLGHLDLIWVIPCVEDIQYPVDQKAKPIKCVIFGTEYTIQVQYHHLRNITYVLLDAPVFRQQTKAEPYPTRMDDIDSAVYYSAWNFCIAEILRRFPVDLYHINDYHGAVAPLHLLPRVIPCCLSLHNAEFQGLWAMRTPSEFNEVCQIYNLPPDVVRRYVQFGEVFNLLHAGASYLRLHQGGYGAAGVSTKYGKRSFARYPVLWGLKKVMGLPNPDPTDVDQDTAQLIASKDITVDKTFEAGRAEQKRLAQEWAHLKQDPAAELFVFVGRWSTQKGIDLIADVFPSVLEEHSKAQLICIGPVIDLYGKFAALKLSKLMEIYPDRVYSKPEFTALPPYIFSGAEFALIPSRDEPFGLVAVEFGRKGALGVGARVGGLGNMPGWWFTVESTTSKHLINQFKIAIGSALASKTQVRARMRAISAKQRFPVALWKQDLAKMHETAMEMSQKQLSRPAAVLGEAVTPGLTTSITSFSNLSALWTGKRSGVATPGEAGTPGLTTPVTSFSNLSALWTGKRSGIATPAVDQSGQTTRAPSPSAGPDGRLSLGSRVGPGHDVAGQARGRKRLSKPRPGSRDSSLSRSFFTRSRANSAERAAAKGKARSRANSAERAVAKGKTRSRANSAERAVAKGKTRSRANSAERAAAKGKTRSRANSAERAAARGKQTEVEPPLPDTSITSPLNLNRKDPNRISRIAEHHDEDNAEQTTSQGDLRQFDFESRNPFDDSGSGRSMNDDTENDTSSVDERTMDEYILTPEQLENEKEKRRISKIQRRLEAAAGSDNGEESSFRRDRHSALVSRPNSMSIPGTPNVDDRLMPNNGGEHQDPFDDSNAPKEPYLSLGSVLQGKKDYKLQSVEPFFTDPTGLYYQAFEQKLQKLNGKNSEHSLCIEDYLVQSERDWFNRYRSVKLGKSAASSRASSIFRVERQAPNEPLIHEMAVGSDDGSEDQTAQFMLKEDYAPPTGIKKIMLRRIGKWPVYTFLLALGQIISANSYQITLLTGAVGQAAEKLYIIASIYLLFSVFWWLVFRKLESKYVLSLPFVIYGVAFFLLGLAPYAESIMSRGWVQNVATGLYAAASASGAFYFSLNFGSEGSVPVSTWSLRACLIQGTQQLYVTMLWYWGSDLTRITVSGAKVTSRVAYGPGLTAITTPIALILVAIGVTLYFGLPDYYRQTPGAIPAFYRATMRRKIVLWFFISVCLQNFFLAAPYGRNWTYLWSSKHAPTWAVLCLVLLFFVGVWIALLGAFAHFSRTHTWILPIFAIGLGCPRWCQMLWGTSNMAQWVPWAGGPLAGALLGRSLWLWLGVLDTIQGCGIGMILLQTLTRFHVSFALVCAQVLGSVATIVGRACAPDADGPGPIFPNLAISLAGLHNAWFWIGLASQGIICVGFLFWFRGEQLMKP